MASGGKRSTAVSRFNGRPAQSVDQVKAVLQGKPKSVALQVQRVGDKIFVPVNVG